MERLKAVAQALFSEEQQKTQAIREREETMAKQEHGMV
jgi:hypothetical protein